MVDLVREMNLVAAEVAKRAVARIVQDDPTRQCFVAGALGPQTRSATVIVDSDRPAERKVTWTNLSRDITSRRRR